MDRSKIDDQYKWDLTKIFKSNEEFDETYSQVKEEINDFTKYEEIMLKDANNSLMYSVPGCVKQSSVIILLFLSNEQRPSNAPIINACLILSLAGLISCVTKVKRSSNVKYFSVKKEKANPLLLPGSTVLHAGCVFGKGFPPSVFAILPRTF